MGKRIIVRALLGAPIGVLITQIISLIISYAHGGSVYYPCVPELTEEMGSELAAVTVQLVGSALWGALCGGASVVWNIETWSLVRQTVIYFAILMGGMLATGYYLYWMPHSSQGGVTYVLIFVAIFVIIWIIEYCIGRVRVRKLNEELARVRKDAKS